MVAPKNDPLRVIPGVGPSISRDLTELGYGRVEDLKGEDPEGRPA
jgi:predicted flap endonuclease-1-like 5' DNA nuclease